jgi:hypothetical protein
MLVCCAVEDILGFSSQVQHFSINKLKMQGMKYWDIYIVPLISNNGRQ